MASADTSSAGTQFIVPKKRRSSISWSVDRPCPISLIRFWVAGKRAIPRVSLNRDGCPVSVCSLQVLLAPVPAHVLCVPFSLSLSPTSPALASPFQLFFVLLLLLQPLIFQLLLL
jgi:hypothetical protein